MKRFLIKGERQLFQKYDQNLIISSLPSSLQGFTDHITFFENQNQSLFNNLLYSEEEESTQTYLKECRRSFEDIDLFEHSISKYNSVYVTNNQTKGKGRLNNIWIGNSSTLCFTYAYHLPCSSSIDYPELYKSIAFIPYLNCVCLVKALQQIGIDKHKAKIKWPNDIYGQKSSGNLAKMAGILCENEQFEYKQMNQEGLVAYCGIGVNFTASPTEFASVAEVANYTNINKGSFLNNFFKIFEISADNLKSEEGRNRIGLELTQNWMHQNQIVNISSDDVGKFKAKIVGISSLGFLEVLSDNKTYEVYPESHSFDVSNNRIITKT